MNARWKELDIWLAKVDDLVREVEEKNTQKDEEGTDE